MNITKPNVTSAEELYGQSAEWLKKMGITYAEGCVVLGSGLGGFIDRLESVNVSIPYHQIPYFPCSTVPGHAGRLVLTMIGDKPILIMQGRFHLYEGHSLQSITLPIHVIRKLGVKMMIVTNAAGGLNPNFNVGDIMIIQDHINLMWCSPLTGTTVNNPRVLLEKKLRIDTYGLVNHELYSQPLISITEQVAQKLKIILRKGIFLGTLGPSYETSAEISMFRRIGADAVSMSTVPEVIVGNHLGMKILGLSCITNLAIPGYHHKLEHSEVIEVTRQVVDRISLLIINIILAESS